MDRSRGVRGPDVCFLRVQPSMPSLHPFLHLTNHPFREALYEDETFPERQLASLVLAKVFYHLGEYDESMSFALGAGDLFRLDHEGEFEETIISKCVDTYISVTAAQHSTLQDVSGKSTLPTLATSFVNGAGDAGTAAALTSPTTPFSSTGAASTFLGSDFVTLARNSCVPLS